MHAIEEIVRRAVTDRLTRTTGREVVAVHVDYMPEVTLVHLNSGGNALAAEAALRRAGYHVSSGPSRPHGATLFVVRPARGLHQHTFQSFTWNTESGQRQADWCGFGAVAAELAEDDTRFCGRLADDPVHTHRGEL